MFMCGSPGVLYSSSCGWMDVGCMCFSRVTAGSGTNLAATTVLEKLFRFHWSVEHPGGGGRRDAFMCFTE